MLQIDKDTVAALEKAQNEWAAQFWAYPPAEMQFEFQDRWLAERGYPARVQGPDGLVWGAED